LAPASRGPATTGPASESPAPVRPRPTWSRKAVPGVWSLRYHVSVNAPARYTVDPAKIVSEIIDGEAILINLTNGYYYSLDTTAAEIWTHLQAGRTALEIVSVLRRRYDCSQTDPEAAVQALIATLEADELIAPGMPSPGPALHMLASDEASGTPFRLPTLQRFSDMQGFLLVDPIHEVDDTGWPNVTPGGIISGRG